MAIFPGAIYKPITAAKGRKALTLHNRVNLHVAVSEAASLHPAFNKTGKVDSHMYVLKDGSVEQYVDTDLRAFADLDGNDATISIETQGGVKDPQGEPWTAAQVATLARIFAWAVATHGVKPQLATSAQLGESSKGLSWHRLGVDGNFPASPSPLAGRTQRGGGMHYSTSRGKVCPGDAKILQIPEILALAAADVEQVASPSVPATPAPAPVLTPGVQRNRFGRPMLAADGFLGPDTIREWQLQMGTLADGVISTGKDGSSLVFAVQRKLVAAGHKLGKVDGFGIFPNTTKASRKTLTVEALQRYLGTPADGVLDCPSTAIKALQRALNAGNF